MNKLLIACILSLFVALTVKAQTGLKKVYDEDVNPIEQIEKAVGKAKADGKFVICQVGGNWCPWCLRFADFISRNADIRQIIDENFEYIHVNYNPRRSENAEKVQQAAALMERLNNCGRFGFPVFVVLDTDGKVIHIQDSSFLEAEQQESQRTGAPAGMEQWYNKEKVVRFLKNWTAGAVRN